jgi:uncharacterized membrane protein YphA (DoxX/SURF4 family)
MNERSPLAFVVPLRIFVGVILLISGYSKFSGGWLHGDALHKTLNDWIAAGKTYSFFLPVIETARAHPKIFGALITSGELVVGASMLLGLLTRLCAFFGTLLMFSIAFGAGQKLMPPGNALLLGSILLTFVLLAPGRAFGLDQLLRSRLPRWMV